MPHHVRYIEQEGNTVSITLGRDPDDLIVRLPRGANWWATLRRTDGVDWPVGSVCQLRFNSGVMWPAVFVGDEIRFSEVAANVNAVAVRQGVDLVYTDGTTPDILWARGKVVPHA